MKRLAVLCAATLLFAGVLVLSADVAQSAAGGQGARERTAPGREAPDRGARRCSVCRLAERLGVQLTPANRIVRFRCCGTTPFAMRWPGGRMRPEDLTALPMQLSMEFDPDAVQTAQVRVRAGEHVLHAESTTFPGSAWDYVTSPYRLHRQAHEALRGVRSELTFEFRFEGYGPLLERRFWLEKPEAAVQLRLRELRAALAQDEPAAGLPWVGMLLEAQVYFDAGFDYAAEKFARRVLKQHPDEPHAMAIQYAVYRVQRFEYMCEAQSLGLRLSEERDRRGKAELDCHLRAEFDPVASRAYTRPRAGCYGAENPWRAR